MKKIMIFLLSAMVVGIIAIAGSVGEKPTLKQYPKGYNGERSPVKQEAEMHINCTSGVQKSGFVNVEKVIIKDPNTAIQLAKNELSEVDLTEYPSISVYYDHDTKWRSILFCDKKINGKGITVYMDENGVTQLIVGIFEE